MTIDSDHSDSESGHSNWELYDITETTKSKGTTKNKQRFIYHILNLKNEKYYEYRLSEINQNLSIWQSSKKL